MTDTHVVSALKTKRIQVASQIESLQGQLRQATIDLDHVEAALRLFDPEVDLAALSPRKVAQVLYDTKGDTGRVMMRRTNANLKHWAKKWGLIRSMSGPGQQLLWEVVR